MGKSVQINGKVDAQAWVEKNGYPEVGAFSEEKILQKFYRQLDTETLEKWCEKEKVEYKACENESIHRMRVAMAILYKHFPKETKGSKKSSKYSDYTTEQLIAMALDNGVVFELCDDNRILRMRAIMALRANKVIE